MCKDEKLGCRLCALLRLYPPLATPPSCTKGVDEPLKAIGQLGQAGLMAFAHCL